MLDMNLEVVKRDGKVVKFEEEKIVNAVKLSAERIRKRLSDNFCNTVVLSTLENLAERDLVTKPITVDNIHLSVENVLWEMDKELYNEYRSYNNYKKRFNHSFNGILKDAKNIIYEGDKENANKDSCIVSTKRDLVSSLVGKELYLEYELAPHLAQAHRNLDFYIHDAGDRLYNSINCCLFDVANVLDGGFTLNGKFIKEPSNPEDAMEKALDLLNDIILVASSQQYGGFTCPELDNTLAKYVKICWDYLVQETNLSEKEVEKIIFKRLCKKFKSIQYKIECVNNANGQTAFVTWTFGTNTTKYGKIVSRAILETRKNNMAIFPKLVLLYHDDFHGEGAPNHDLYLECIKVSMKSIYPDYTSAMDGYMKEVYDRCGTIISPMGCRAFLSPYWDENGKERYIGRFNLGAITLNLPRYAILSGGNEDEFFRLVDKYFDYAMEVHDYTYNKMKKTKAKTNPLLFTQGGCIVKLDPEDTIEKALESCTYSIGYIGLTEVCYLMTGKHLHEDNAFGIKTLRYIQDKIERAKVKHGKLIAMYGTPSEGLCDKLCRADRKEFGTIPFVTDKKWYHNSFHVGSNFDIDAIAKQKAELPMFHISTGGHIMYNEFDNVDNFEAFKEVVDFAMKNGEYYGPNTEQATCNECGAKGEFTDKCGKCGSTNITVIDRVCGYLGYKNVNGNTRYNEGKNAEVENRVKHFSVFVD